MAKKNAPAQDTGKNLGLRIALFVIALAVAIGAFTYGITHIGQQEAGWADVDAPAQETVTHYADGIALRYEFTGSTAENRVEKQALLTAYGAALLRAYCLTDPVNEYEGYVNLATINHHPGEELEVPEELFGILTDAAARSGEGSAFSLYAGPFYTEWDSVLYLADAPDFDPLANTDQAERLAQAADHAYESAGVRLTVTDEAARKVKLELGSAYRAFLSDFESDGTVLSLGPLREAYELRMVADALNAQNLGHGYLTSDSGLTVTLNACGADRFVLYAIEESTGAAAERETVPVKPGAAMSAMRSFALADGEAGYYEVTAADTGETVLRHPHAALPDGPSRVLQASYVIDSDGDVTDAVCRNLELQAAQSAQELPEKASAGAAQVRYYLWP